MIVKVQLSLSTTAEKQQMLIYDESRENSYSGAVPVTMKGFPPKSYWEARIDGGVAVLYKRIPDQEW